MALKLIEIILLISVGGSMVFAVPSNEELGSSPTAPEKEHISTQNVNPPTPDVTVTHNQPREIIWSECKQEVVNDTETWYETSPTLRPLADEALRHVSFRTAGGRTEYLNMQLGLHATHYACIILSPEREPKDTGFHFYIGIDKFIVYLRSLNGLIGQVLTRARTRTPLFRSQPAAPVLLTVSNDTLQLRHESSGEPFLEYLDERLKYVKYFGFCSNYNNDGQATIYYDC